LFSVAESRISIEYPRALENSDLDGAVQPKVGLVELAGIEPATS
jgi:hypothetical protein